MSVLVERAGDVSSRDEIEIEISQAAIGAYGRLMRVVGRRLFTHAARDGGLICESRASRTRPTMWRILPDGEILPDTPYSYARGEFVAGLSTRRFAAGELRSTVVDEGTTMAFSPGDHVLAETESTERAPRRGVVEQVLHDDPRPRYRIRWDDGHESVYTPADGALRPDVSATHST